MKTYLLLVALATSADQSQLAEPKQGNVASAENVALSARQAATKGDLRRANKEMDQALVLLKRCHNAVDGSTIRECTYWPRRITSEKVNFVVP